MRGKLIRCMKVVELDSFLAAKNAPLGMRHQKHDSCKQLVLMLIHVQTQVLLKDFVLNIAKVLATVPNTHISSAHLWTRLVRDISTINTRPAGNCLSASGPEAQCKKTKRKLLSHLQQRADDHSQLRVIASLSAL
ncbi:hypothetical protein HaLaN_13469, partial [Haematococcus lacustris]